MNTLLVCARCRSTLSQRGRMYCLSQASFYSLCRVQMFLCQLSPNGITACMELHRPHAEFFTPSAGIHRGTSFTSIATGDDCRATRGHSAASHAGHSKFRSASKFVTSRVRACDDVSRRCFLGDRGSRADTRDPFVLKNAGGQGCHPIPLHLISHQLLPHTEQFAACLWFGVGLSQWSVACGQASADPEFAAREHDVNMTVFYPHRKL